jgi:hypothetical protein
MAKRPIDKAIGQWDILDNGCWQWRGETNEGGYGLVDHWGDCWLAHRVVYAHYRGDIPVKMTLDHLCRNRACVNPDHLEVVTRGENARRRRMLS